MLKAKKKRKEISRARTQSRKIKKRKVEDKKEK